MSVFAFGYASSCTLRGSSGAHGAPGPQMAIESYRLPGCKAHCRETATSPFLGLRVFPEKGSESTPEHSWILFNLKDPDGHEQAQGVRGVLQLLL